MMFFYVFEGKFLQHKNILPLVIALVDAFKRQTQMETCAQLKWGGADKSSKLQQAKGRL